MMWLRTFTEAKKGSLPLRKSRRRGRHWIIHTLSNVTAPLHRERNRA